MILISTYLRHDIHNIQDNDFDDDVKMDMVDEYDICRTHLVVNERQGTKIRNTTTQPCASKRAMRIDHCGCVRIEEFSWMFLLATLRRFVTCFGDSYVQATDFLIAIAEPLSRPQFIHEYRITDSSLYGAVSVGLETDKIIEALERMSKVDLSPKMIDYIRMKTATYGKAKLVLRNGKYRISFQFNIRNGCLQKVSLNPISRQTTSPSEGNSS